jgi:hypothetical protein
MACVNLRAALCESHGGKIPPTPSAAVILTMLTQALSAMTANIATNDLLTLTTMRSFCSTDVRERGKHH